VEKTELVTERIEKVVASTLPPVKEPGKDDAPLYTTMLSDTGLPGGRTALFTANTGSHSANIGINLVGRLQRPISDVEATEKVRAALANALPGTQVFFFTGGIVKRILNFGAAAPIDVEVLGYDLKEGSAFAKQLTARMSALVDEQGQPLLTDVQIQREEN